MSRRSHSRKIETRFHTNIEKLKNTLEKVNYLCTTADVWSAKRRSFMGVTVHWIDEYCNCEFVMGLQCNNPRVLALFVDYGPFLHEFPSHPLLYVVSFITSCLLFRLFYHAVLFTHRHNNIIDSPKIKKIDFCHEKQQYLLYFLHIC